MPPTTGAGGQGREGQDRHGSRASGLTTLKPPARYGEARCCRRRWKAPASWWTTTRCAKPWPQQALGTAGHARGHLHRGPADGKSALVREGRELIPTAKGVPAHDVLLRGLGVPELTQAELTGEWGHKLSRDRARAAWEAR
ncbi:hypothetical protein ACTMU2_37855 [Cupriavidus basilensis]